MNERPSDHWAADGGTAVGVLAVDDQLCFRELLREVVAATSGFYLVGEACSGEEAIAVADLLAPEVVLMDIRLPGMDGISATKAILGRHPGIAVVLISVDDPDRDPGARSLGKRVARVCKCDLRPQTLRDVWAEARSARLGHDPSQPACSTS